MTTSGYSRGISRKTGYKLYRRYRDIGLDGLTDRSLQALSKSQQAAAQHESRIVQLCKEHPTWGAPKIREKRRRLELGVQTPAISTVHAVLDRLGLVTRLHRSTAGATRPRGRRCPRPSCSATIKASAARQSR